MDGLKSKKGENKTNKLNRLININNFPIPKTFHRTQKCMEMPVCDIIEEELLFNSSFSIIFAN
jgi:hypothetical protein